jgi:dUTP pyrophosphatase
MSDVKIKIKLGPNGKMPTKAHDTDACFDVYSAHGGHIYTGQAMKVVTDLFMDIPAGWEAQIRGRSGLAFKHRVLSLFGTIDAGYHGEIGLMLMNEGPAFSFEKGDRVAQFKISRVPEVELELVEEFTQVTERGEKGFGSSGSK